MIIKTYGQKALEIKPIIENHLNKIYENIKNFATVELFNNLTIEICDPSSPDCPEDIKKYAGLTFQDKKLIQLNATVTEFFDNPDKYYSNLISHEFGHYWAFNSGFDNENSELRKIWQAIRGDAEASLIIPTELVAEDFRLLFGSNQAKNFARGNYKQANEVQGLTGLMRVLPSFTEYKKSLLSQNRSIISSSKYITDSFNDFGFMVTDRHNFFFWDYQTYFFDNNNVWKYDYSFKKWNIIKYL